MKLHLLPKVTLKKQKRQGQGRGSGKGGHTSGRGQKGQNTRASIGLIFEGTKIKKSLLKRLPLMRGKGKFKSKAQKPAIISLNTLNRLPEGSVIDGAFLAKEGIIDSKTKVFSLKILGNGELTRKLTVKLPVSASAKAKIEKAGGQVLTVEEKQEKVEESPKTA